MHKRFSSFWLILGIGSQLQVLFSLSMTEIIVLLMAPCLLFSEVPHMRRTGVMTFFWIAILLFCGCVVSLIVNSSQFYQVIRGVSVTSLIVCSIVVGHFMLRNCPEGLKWYFIGVLLSSVISIFAFQRSVEVMMAGGEDADLIMSGKLFWIQRVSTLVQTPLLASYLHTPLVYCFVAPLALGFFSILTSSSGRAAALAFFGAAAIIAIGRKKRKSMSMLGKHFFMIFCCAVVGVFAMKSLYQWAALNNLLGEESRTKYEAQTAGGSGIVQLLIGGRADSFMGLLAVADSPIVGKGYWARDTEGYREQFLAKYGTVEDYEHYRNYMTFMRQKGLMPDRGIPCHSHIISFWVWYGLPGLIFWIYVIYVIFRFLRYDVAVVPQWYYWLAAGVPGLMWHMFFSPFSGRFGLPLIVIGMLLARAIRLGKHQLSYEMIIEIEENERR